MKLPKWARSLGFLVCGIPIIVWFVRVDPEHGAGRGSPFMPIVFLLIAVDAFFWILIYKDDWKKRKLD
jgi:hypothetical protein